MTDPHPGSTTRSDPSTGPRADPDARTAPRSDAPIGVVGATGQQGGAVVAALLDRGAPVRALVRDPAKAADLADRGVEVTRADQDDPDSLRQAFSGLSALFVMTTMTGSDGTEGEIAHGKAMADAARDAGAPQLVYSSVGAAEQGTGIPHFESKWQVEEYLRGLGLPVVVIRPTFFMENFTGFFAPKTEDHQLVVRAPLTPGVPVQMIAVADIGRAAASALLDPESVGGGAVEIAGDELSGEQVAERFGAQQGLPARFEALPVDSLGDPDQEAMFSWLGSTPSYRADFEATRQLVGHPLDFAAFLRR